MVVKEDGTKWACQSCLKGHRVSGCTHTDRELFFVPKKGRPVTQCQHCRAERKKRSSHVKCDCGDKVHSKEKCVHLREAEAKAAAAAAAAGAPTVPNAMCHGHSPDLMPVAEESPSSDEHHCCCPHGGHCTCSTMKKESLSEDAKETKEAKEPKASPKKDVAKETKAVSRSLSQRKPKLASHQSEGHLTVFANGHHKPVHRNNNAAHESGAPYKLPRSHTTQPVPATTRRSIDSLASVASNQPHAWFSNNMPIHSTNSGTGSPVSATTAQHDYMQQDNRSPVDASAQYPVSTISSSVPTSMFEDFGFPSTSSIATSTTDASMPAFSMPSSDFSGMSNPEFWANFNWSKIGSTSFDAQPALTHTSSGTMSEVDEIPATEDTTTFDNSYSMNMQDLVTGHNNNSNNSSTFDLDFGVPTSQSDGWTMPTYNQNSATGADLNAMSADSFSKPKPIPDQSMILNQFSGFDMSSSVQSQSPVHSNFNWDQSIFDYGMSNNSTNSLAYSMPGSTGPSVAPTAAPSPKYTADSGNYTQDFDFETSAKLVWSDNMDSMVVPAGQDFLNTYNYDQNFSTTDFDNNSAWTS